MRVFSAIQPTAKIHLGNYLGAIKQFLKFQDKECIFAIADLHAITVPYKPEELQKNIFEVLVSFLAAGIDPQKSIIFVQSQVPEHTQLAWLLGTLVPVGDLFRMTQYKEKKKQYKKEGVGSGILNYPILMAADILLYKAEIVPVGEDQRQHLELTREIARRFNKKFGYLFPEPKPIFPDFAGKIRALNDPKKKMSKSSPEGCIFIFDEEEMIREKIMKAVTDSGKEIKYDPKRKPGISNLIMIFSALSGKNIKEIEKEFENSSYENFKKALANFIIEYFKPLRKKRESLLKRELFLREILEQGRKKAQNIAKETFQQVKLKMGLI